MLLIAVSRPMLPACNSQKSLGVLR